jgi:hypothetical protein
VREIRKIIMVAWTRSPVSITALKKNVLDRTGLTTGSPGGTTRDCAMNDVWTVEV